MPIVDYDKGFKVKVGHKSWEIFVQTYDNAQPSRHTVASNCKTHQKKVCLILRFYNKLAADLITYISISEDCMRIVL